MNTLEEVKEKVNKGVNVYWKTLLYKVIKMNGDYYVKWGNGGIAYLDEDFNPSDFFYQK